MMRLEVCILVLCTLVCQVFTACNFACTSDTTFVVSKVAFKCATGQLCNVYHNEQDCRPCVPQSLKCANKFRCVASKPKDVIIGGVQVSCPNQYKCNSKGEGECPPCVHDGCDEPAFECTDDPAMVYIMNMLVSCRPDTVCNRQNVPPCYPCIPKEVSRLARLGVFNHETIIN